MSGFVTPTIPNLTDYTTFIRGAGIGALYLPSDSLWITLTFDVSMAIVNQVLNAASPLLYTQAVYNLAMDRLINFAPDEQGQQFFQALREKSKLTSFAPGVVSSTGDNGTNTSLMNLDVMKNLTLGQLQNMKTGYGRQYLSIAQMYGPTIWGVS